MYWHRYNVKLVQFKIIKVTNIFGIFLFLQLKSISCQVNESVCFSGFCLNMKMNAVAIFSGDIYARKEKEPENFAWIKGNGLSDFSLASIAYKTLKKTIFECWMVRGKSISAPSPATANCAGGKTQLSLVHLS